MRARGPLIAVLSLAFAAPLLAQGAAAPKPALPNAAQPTKEQIEDAAYEMRVMVSALQSEQVEAPVKDALFQCLYNNNFKQVSEAMAKVIAQNPGKVEKRNPDHMLGVMAGVCGYRPKAAGAAAPAGPVPATPAPATPARPQGR